jgi:hypothetical protein
MAHIDLDINKNLTEKRLGLPGTELIRLIIWENTTEESWERKDGNWVTVDVPRRMVYDIVEGTRRQMIRWFNNHREDWLAHGVGKIDVRAETVPAYNGGH